MKIPVRATLAIAVHLCFASAGHASQTFGAAPALSTAPLALSEAVKPENLGRSVRVEARTGAVCEKKGCWLTLVDGSTTVRVTFKDYGFFVPKDLPGKTVVVEGTLAETTVSEKEARHYAKDQGLPKSEIAKIRGDKKQVTMVATTVVVP